MDADAAHNKPLAQKYGVSSFPTIKFFGAGEENKANPMAYNGGRDEKAFVEFLNEKCGTHRTIGGGLNHLAGRIPSLDELAQKFIDATTDVRTTIISEAAILGKEAKRYTHVMEKIMAKSNDYIHKELKRYALDLPPLNGRVSCHSSTDWSPFSRRALLDPRNSMRSKSSSTFFPLSLRERLRKRSPELGMSYNSSCSTTHLI